MSMTSTDIDAALAGAAAVVRCLPAGLSAGQALEGAAGLDQAIPAPDAKAVSASLSGNVTGTLVLVLSADIAETVENGPIGPQELVAGLEVALTDATAALAAAFGPVRHEAAMSIAADVALSSASSYSSVTVVPLIGALGLTGSLVVMIDHTPQSAGVPDNVAGAATFDALSSVVAGGGANRSVELLNDVEMGVTAELGRTRMTVRELLSLQPGSIVELDRAAGSPVDLLVNGTLVARGEVVVIDEEFGVRITEIIGYDAKKQG